MGVLLAPMSLATSIRDPIYLGDEISYPRTLRPGTSSTLKKHKQYYSLNIQCLVHNSGHEHPGGS